MAKECYGEVLENSSRRTNFSITSAR